MIVTQPLVSREMSLADLDFIPVVLAHAEVMGYWPKCYDRHEATDWVKRQQERSVMPHTG